MDEAKPNCSNHERTKGKVPVRDPASFERAERLLRAMGDANRLRLLHLLRNGEWCVSEMVDHLGEKFSTISQRLSVLRNGGLVTRRRKGTHIFYALADSHVVEMLDNALVHADELSSEPVRKGVEPMSNTHPNHDHDHGPNCGHTAVKHGDHVDYLHDGHLHHVGENGVEEHSIEVGTNNPGDCTPNHDCGSHDKAHTHGPDCGHEEVPHGDHVDYLVDGHLHHPHGDHCDDHGPVEKA